MTCAAGATCCQVHPPQPAAYAGHGGSTRALDGSSTSATSARGKHTLKYGADLRYLRETSINYGNSAGSYTFATNWTRGPLDNAAGAPNGQAFASLLLGLLFGLLLVIPLMGAILWYMSG